MEGGPVPVGANTCFICLSDDSVDALIRPCKCNLPVHRSCLTRWQLQRFGSRDEKYCRLCQQELPNWTSPSLAPLAADDDEFVQSVPMTIQVNGRTHVIAARPGVDGMLEFQSAVRRKLGLPDNVQIVFAVSCSLPHCSNLTILVKGLRSYHVAIRCMSAQVRRRQQPHTQPQHLTPCCGMPHPQHHACCGGSPLHNQGQSHVESHAQEEAPSLASSPPSSPFSSPPSSPRSWTAKLDPKWEPDWVNMWEPDWEPVSESCSASLTLPPAGDSSSGPADGRDSGSADLSTALESDSDFTTTLCRVGGPHGTLRELPLPRHAWQVPARQALQPVAQAHAGTSTAARHKYGGQHALR